MEWISVKKKKPKEMQDVLLFCVTKCKKFNFIVQARRAPRDLEKRYNTIWGIKMFGTNCWHALERQNIINPFDRSHYYEAKVTHWMPLPEAPK